MCTANCVHNKEEFTPTPSNLWQNSEASLCAHEPGWTEANAALDKNDINMKIEINIVEKKKKSAYSYTCY